MEGTMKKFLIIFFLAASLMPASVASAAEQQADKTVKETLQLSDSTALQSFQPIVQKFTNFFKKNPKLLVKVSPPQAPEVKTYSIHHFLARRAYYDLFKTNSIVTPYNGFIDIDTEVLDNKQCGDMSLKTKEKEGWANINVAIANADNKDCLVSRTEKTGPLRQRFHFDYSALRNKWELTNITYQDGTPNERFMVILGVASPWFPVMDEPQAQSFNKDWIDLLKNP